jgi:transcriptional regulator with PAS, ATPase and Fis domain
MALTMQSKLLRVIQERAVRPLGHVNEVPVNVRVVSATHKDLEVEVQAGRFRQDLHHRLNVIQIMVPPLRERLDDLARDVLVHALERHRYNRTAAGASLGLSLRQMRYRMAGLSILAGDGSPDATR